MGGEEVVTEYFYVFHSLCESKVINLIAKEASFSFTVSDSLDYRLCLLVTAQPMDINMALGSSTYTRHPHGLWLQDYGHQHNPRLQCQSWTSSWSSVAEQTTWSPVQDFPWSCGCLCCLWRSDWHPWPVLSLVAMLISMGRAISKGHVVVFGTAEAGILVHVSDPCYHQRQCGCPGSLMLPEVTL